MIKEFELTRVECPACGYRMLDKGDEAAGLFKRSAPDVNGFGKLNSKQVISNKLAENQ